jgi:hypothetical protein
MNRANLILNLFEQTHSYLPGDQVMRFLRGNLASLSLFIAPPPTADEYDKQVPFSNHNAAIFHEILKDVAGIDTNKDCLVVACSVFGLKPKMSSCAPIRAFVQEVASKNLFKTYSIIGSSAYQFIIGEGKKHSMSVLAGQVIWLKWLKKRPLFVFPDIENLYYEPSIEADFREIKSMQYKAFRARALLRTVANLFTQKIYG